MKLPSHEATTAQLGALYLGVEPEDNGASRILVGRQQSGTLFCPRPPSSCTASVGSRIQHGGYARPDRPRRGARREDFLYRQAAFGRRIVVLDPKGSTTRSLRSSARTRSRYDPGNGAPKPAPIDSGRRPERATAWFPSQRAVRPVERVGAREGAHTGRAPERRSARRRSSDTGRTLLSSDSFGRCSDLDGRRRTDARTSVEELRRGVVDLAFELRRFVFPASSRACSTGRTSPNSRPGRLTSSCFDLVGPLQVQTALGPVPTCAGPPLGPGPARRATSADRLRDRRSVGVDGQPGSRRRFLQASFKLARLGVRERPLVAHRVPDLAAQVEPRDRPSLASTRACLRRIPRDGGLPRGAGRRLPIVRRRSGTATEQCSCQPPRGIALWHVGTAVRPGRTPDQSHRAAVRRH